MTPHKPSSEKHTFIHVIKSNSATNKNFNCLTKKQVNIPSTRECQSTAWDQHCRPREQPFCNSSEEKLDRQWTSQKFPSLTPNWLNSCFQIIFKRRSNTPVSQVWQSVVPSLNLQSALRVYVNKWITRLRGTVNGSILSSSAHVQSTRGWPLTSSIHAQWCTHSNNLFGSLVKKHR